MSDLFPTLITNRTTQVQKTAWLPFLKHPVPNYPSPEAIQVIAYCFRVGSVALSSIFAFV